MNSRIGHRLQAAEAVPRLTGCGRNGRWLSRPSARGLVCVPCVLIQEFVCRHASPFQRSDRHWLCIERALFFGVLKAIFDRCFQMANTAKGSTTISSIRDLRKEQTGSSASVIGPTSGRVTDDLLRRRQILQQHFLRRPVCLTQPKPAPTNSVNFTPSESMESQAR